VVLKLFTLFFNDPDISIIFGIGIPQIVYRKFSPEISGNIKAKAGNELPAFICDGS